MITPFTHQPCGCRIQRLREIPWNLKTFFLALVKGKRYSNWDGFEDDYYDHY